MTRDMRVAKTSEIHVAYTEHGASDGRPVFLLHGFPYGPSTFDAMIERMQPEKHGLRLIVPWMRGYGATVVQQQNLVSGEKAAFAADVLVLADALGIARFTVFGHDWGSHAGFALSVLQPERVVGHLALASPYEMFGGAMPALQADQYWYQWYFQTAQGEKALRETHEELCRHIWERWSPEWDFSKSEFAACAKDRENPQWVDVTLSSYRHRWGNALGRPAYAAAQAVLDAKPKAKISVPTMYVFGTGDGCVVPAAHEGQEKYFIGKYEAVGVKGVGHLPMAEDAKAVVKLAERFLRETA